jgi:signal transduction histidine kinase
MYLEIAKMQIRTRLTLQFLLLGGIIIIIASLAIYVASSNFRRADFYNRLWNKSRSAAKLLFDANEINPERLRRIDKDNPVNLHNEKIIILNFKDDTLYSSDVNGEIEIKNDVLYQVRLGKIMTYKQGPYEVLGTLYLAKLDRFVVIAAAIDLDGIFYLRKLKLILIAVCLVSLVLFFMAGWFYSGRALKPISEVVKNVEVISITSLNLRVFEGNGKDEIGRLAKTFNKMLERLETSFAMQKDFIANASHELRTPLTSVNGQLEVLLLKDRSTEEYKSALSSVLEDIKSLIDLANRLLLLARTSAEGPVNMIKKVRIDEVLWQAQEELKKFKKEYHINIVLDKSLTDYNQMTVIGDEYLLKVAVSNIIDNACKYSAEHTVGISIHHIENMIEVIFEDKGIGISEVDLQKIFEPFYRGSNALSIAGSGIGLQLVNQIIKNHNGTISVVSQIGKGTTVTILLPTI